jgi:hypothetical protein
MVLANVNGIGSLEMVGLLIDFLTESRAGLVSLRPQRKMRAMNGTVNVLGPMSPNECGPQLRTTCEAALTECVGRFG